MKSVPEKQHTHTEESTWVLQDGLGDRLLDLEAQQPVCQVWRGGLKALQQQPDDVLSGGILHTPQAPGLCNRWQVTA